MTTDNPAASYAEWKKSGPKRTDSKQRYEIAPEGGGTIAFAGLYAPWGNDAVEDESHRDAWLLSCTILTMPAPRWTPAILPLQGWERCMTGCRSLLRPARSTLGWIPGTRTALVCWTWCEAYDVAATGPSGPSSSSKTRTGGSASKQWKTLSSEATHSRADPPLECVGPRPTTRTGTGNTMREGRTRRP
jgi:hypothetical protein